MSNISAEAQSDADMMRRLAAGDPDVLKLLLRRHLARVVRIAERITGNKADAEDIAQEVIVRLWKKAPDWSQDGARVHTWLYRVTVNLCIDRTRKRKPEGADVLEQLPANEPGAEKSVYSGEMHRLVARLLDKLTEKQRLALVLYYFEGMAVSDVAACMDISAGAATGLLHRGRGELKELLAGTGIVGWERE